MVSVSKNSIYFIIYDCVLNLREVECYLISFTFLHSSFVCITEGFCRQS